MATMVDAVPEAWKMAWERTTRYTPAVTMVAAWISAETGVGPSIASGNQTCSGSWADLPTAPANSSKARIVAVPFGRVWAPENTGPKSSEWSFDHMKTIPIRNAESPIRVV